MTDHLSIEARRLYEEHEAVLRELDKARREARQAILACARVTRAVRYIEDQIMRVEAEIAQDDLESLRAITDGR